MLVNESDARRTEPELKDVKNTRNSAVRMEPGDDGAGSALRLNQQVSLLAEKFRGCERRGHALLSAALNDSCRTIIDVQAIVYDSWKAAQAAVEAQAKV